MNQPSLFQPGHEADTLERLKALWLQASESEREAFNDWRRRAFLALACERQRRRRESKA